MICAYLLKSLKDKKNYIGSTIDLSKRIEQHQLGHVTSTKYRRPLILTGYKKCKNIKEAAQLEKRYKKK